MSYADFAKKHFPLPQPPETPAKVRAKEIRSNTINALEYLSTCVNPEYVTTSITAEEVFNYQRYFELTSTSTSSINWSHGLVLR